MSLTFKRNLGWLVFAANLLAVVWIWWSGPSHFSLATGGLGGWLQGLGTLCGLVAAYLVLWQLVLIGRVRWVEQAFGFDRLSRWHHYNGLAAIVLIIIHPILIITGFALPAHTGLVAEFFVILRVFPDILKAVLGWLLIVTAVGLSINMIRKKLDYELWYWIHFCIYAAIVLYFGHQYNAGRDFIGRPNVIAYWWLLYAIAFGSIGFYRWLWPIWLWYRHRFVLQKIVPETLTASSFYITGQDLDQFKVQPGQFVLVRFLTEDLITQEHPFTVSRVPDGQAMTFTAKAVGDFTKAIQSLKPGTKVLISGPHGLFTDEVSRKKAKLLIAGGIGITPLRALLANWTNQPDQDLVLLYAARSKAELAFKAELEGWAAAGKLKLKYLIDPARPTDPRVPLDSARIRELVPDAAKREVWLCGPPPMMKTVRRSLADLGITKADVHYERFSLG